MDKSLLSSLFSNALSHAVPVLVLLLLTYVAAGCVHSVQTRPRETPAAKGMTALDRYVAEPDPAFAFEHISTQEREGVTAHLLSMTSQTWRSEAEVDAPAWRHWVTIFKPAHIDSETAMLFITGGALDDDAPAPEGMLAQLAVETRSVVIELRMVPNQPLYFKDEPFKELREQGRYEDEVIAYSWRKYLETDDPTWVVQLPMVKSAVRAMDAATAFLASDAGGGVSIEDFVVSGASKRGWTTWLTAAVDVRVKAIIPIVIDMLHELLMKGKWLNHQRLPHWRTSS